MVMFCESKWMSIDSLIRYIVYLVCFRGVFVYLDLEKVSTLIPYVYVSEGLDVDYELLN